LINEKVAETDFDVQSQARYFQNLTETSQELKKYETSLLKIESALPRQSSLPELLNFLQKASSQTGLSLSGLSPFSTAPTKEGNLGETKLNLAVVGTYSAFKDFISVLEKSARFIEVDNISFSSPKEGLFTFNISLKVYFY
jgi:Tfp pilus assembly protein PilO